MSRGLTPAFLIAVALMFAAPVAAADSATVPGTALPAPDLPAPVVTGAPTDPQVVLGAINAARQANGVAPVKLSGRLSRGCRRYARTMIAKGRWTHARPVKMRGFKAVAEILARMHGTPSMSWVTDAWLNSSVHRSVLLDPSYRAIGVGTSKGMMAGKKTTVWVVRFAR